MGDGLMLLLNAPVPCPEPALRGVRMALEMQASVQAMIAGWRARGHTIGFGVGLAKGPATVGRIGYEGRSDYTAIGNVVNLASRICAAAEDGQILIDPAAAAEIGMRCRSSRWGRAALRGFAEAVAVFSVAEHDRDLMIVPAGLPHAASALVHTRRRRCFLDNAFACNRSAPEVAALGLQRRVRAGVLRSGTR